MKCKRLGSDEPLSLSVQVKLALRIPLDGMGCACHLKMRANLSGAAKNL